MEQLSTDGWCLRMQKPVHQLGSFVSWFALTLIHNGKVFKGRRDPKMEAASVDVVLVTSPIEVPHRCCAM